MNKHLLYIFFMLVIFSCCPVLGQEKQTTIDSLYSICLDQNQSTQGMIHCAQDAQIAWDKEMNKYYNKLMEILTNDEKEKLKSSQKKWLTYKDSEFEFSGTMYSNIGGTMWLITNADRQATIVKTRALELMDYYSNIVEGK